MLSNPLRRQRGRRKSQVEPCGRGPVPRGRYVKLFAKGATFSPIVSLGALTARLKGDASWGDEYPAWQVYADECESLLEFLDGQRGLERFWPRLRSKSQQRDEALNEIRVAYFLGSIGHPVTGWEPEDAPGYRVEFAVSLGTGRNAVVEVKSPGWESEVTQAERLSGRLRLPKHLDLEGRAADPIGVIRRAVEKARPKFSGKRPSLLVVSDDCFVNLGEWGWGPIQMALLQKSIAYGNGLFHRSDYANIGAVCLFWVDALPGSGGVEYRCVCKANPNALATAVIPSEVVAKLSVNPINPRV